MSDFGLGYNAFSFSNLEDPEVWPSDEDVREVPVASPQVTGPTFPDGLLEIFDTDMWCGVE